MTGTRCLIFRRSLVRWENCQLCSRFTNSVDLHITRLHMDQNEQSRNSWINKGADDPSKVSARYKGEYEDILEERRHTSDMWWATRSRTDVPKYKNNFPRSPKDIKQHVLRSDRVRHTVNELMEEMTLPRDEVMAEAKAILDEMAHNLNMPAIRSFAVVLTKVVKALYKRLYVNKDGIQRVRQLIKEYPVLLLPSHRSYADFLLLSYVFYHYDLPLPAIAAAMDFKGMKFVGWLLRNSGAFYIRRSFGTDKLYWAVFTEYLQTQISNSDSPIEFFVEGTRSRTAKSYVPRIGMLSAALEPYFKASVPDIMVIPISISYDRILEETLYAYELLGVPKPKESTSGLMKARGILSEDFGNIHMYFGEPISIRTFSVGKIDRVCHAIEPRFMTTLTDQETQLMKDLAYETVRRHQKFMVISPWSLIAAILLQNQDGIPVRQLLKEVEWLKRQVSNLGAEVDWPTNETAESILRRSVAMHENVASVDKNGLVLVKVNKQTKLMKKALPEEVLNTAATCLILSSCKNQLLHVFVRVALVSLSVNLCDSESLSVDELYRRYCFLETLLNREFIFQPGQTKQDFSTAVLNLTHCGGLFLSNNEVLIKKSINKYTTFFSQMFEPFLFAYWVMCGHLLSLNGDVHGRPLPKQPKAIAKDAQQLATRLIQDGVVKHYEILSLDTLGNALNALTDLKAMYKDKRNETDTYLSPNHVAVARITEEIGKYIEVPAVAMKNFIVQSKNIIITAKL